VIIFWAGVAALGVLLALEAISEQQG